MMSLRHLLDVHVVWIIKEKSPIDKKEDEIDIAFLYTGRNDISYLSKTGRITKDRTRQ